MHDDIDISLLRQFSRHVAVRMGLNFSPSRWPDMVYGLERAARQFGQPGAEACMRWLMAEPLQRHQVEILASHLTVGETYFYREPAVFDVLERDILPGMIAERRSGDRNLRIWSAGCSTGEEIYSLAILLVRLLPDLEHWNLTLLGTDINPQFLARAARGEYREWSFRSTPAWFRQNYFTACAGHRFAILPRIRRLVSFAYLNLVDDMYPSMPTNTNGMDVVFCRNVLMYFSLDTARAVLEKLWLSLREGGWLVVSVTEAGADIFSRFSAIEFGNIVLYRKALEHENSPKPLRLPRLPAAKPCDLARIDVSAMETVVAKDTPALVTTPLVARHTEPAVDGDAYQEALACYERGDYTEAAALIASASRPEPQALALAARACANLGQLEDAYRWCRAAVEIDKCRPDLRYLLASVLSEQGQADAAATALQQALYLDPDFVLAHYALSNVYRRRNQHTKAARHLAQARKLLVNRPSESALPGGEGLTAGRLLEIIDCTEQAT